MHREYHRWRSTSLRRDMELLVFGHAGARVLAFPTSMGRFFDWEDRGMVAMLGDHLERGWIQLYCVDSVDAESWYDKRRQPTERALRHEQFERYLINEVLPFSAARNTNPYLITTGASFGAYHAANFAFRHPQLVGRVVGMSGLYDVKKLTGGFSDDAIYFNNPSDYLRHEHDPARLDALRRMDIILAIGRDDANYLNNEELSSTLAGRGIPHGLRVWDGWAHDWRYWQQMIWSYLAGLD